LQLGVLKKTCLQLTWHFICPEAGISNPGSCADTSHSVSKEQCLFFPSSSYFSPLYPVNSLVNESLIHPLPVKQGGLDPNNLLTVSNTVFLKAA